MVMSYCVAMGLPSSFAGAYRHFRRAFIAASRNRTGPESTFIEVTLPEIPISAWITTSPCTPFCLASDGYTGDTEEINFGGCTLPPWRIAASGAAGATGAARPEAPPVTIESSEAELVASGMPAGAAAVISGTSASMRFAACVLIFGRAFKSPAYRVCTLALSAGWFESVAEAAEAERVCELALDGFAEIIGFGAGASFLAETVSFSTGAARGVDGVETSSEDAGASGCGGAACGSVSAGAAGADKAGAAVAVALALPEAVELRRTYVTAAAITVRMQAVTSTGNSFERERGAEPRATDERLKVVLDSGDGMLDEGVLDDRALAEGAELNVCNSPNTGRTGFARRFSGLRAGVADFGRRPGTGIFSAAGAGAGVSTSAATADSTEELAATPARGSICSFCQVRAGPYAGALLEAGSSFGGSGLGTSRGGAAGSIAGENVLSSIGGSAFGTTGGADGDA